MISMQKNGAELADKLAELREIEKSEAYRVAEKMRVATAVIDDRLASARRREREGRALIEQGVSLEALDEILRTMDTTA